VLLNHDLPTNTPVLAACLLTVITGHREYCIRLMQCKIDWNPASRFFFPQSFLSFSCFSYEVAASDSPGSWPGVVYFSLPSRVRDTAPATNALWVNLQPRTADHIDFWLNMYMKTWICLVGKCFCFGCTLGEFFMHLHKVHPGSLSTYQCVIQRWVRGQHFQGQDQWLLRPKPVVLKARQVAFDSNAEDRPVVF